MSVKKGDNVIVITGKDRGKKGKVLKALPQKESVVVEGVNVVKRHSRARKSNEQGQIVEKPMPIHISNIRIV